MLLVKDEVKERGVEPDGQHHHSENHQLTLSSGSLAQRFRILALASNDSTCSLWASSLIALSFDVIGFLGGQ